MNQIENTKLQFFKMSKTEVKYTDTADFLDAPRPFWSVGMIFAGSGTFQEQNRESIEVFPGDIILVPTAATYISHWTGSPDICYISFHFILNRGFRNNIAIQKIAGLNFLKKEFETAYQLFGEKKKTFQLLSIFFHVLAEVYPKIQQMPEKPLNTSIQKAIEHITFGYQSDLSIRELAAASNLSPSRFFTVFKQETGMTPISYKNYISIQNAEKMLLTTDFSMEEISEKLGFHSSSYFRRTFRAFTGKSPREYRKEIQEKLKL